MSIWKFFGQQLRGSKTLASGLSIHDTPKNNRFNFNHLRSTIEGLFSRVKALNFALINRVAKLRAVNPETLNLQRKWEGTRNPVLTQL